MDLENSKETFRHFLLNCPLRETQFSDVDGETLHFGQKSSSAINDVDFFVTYYGVTYRLEILWEGKFGVDRRDTDKIDAILLEGYKQLKETFEYDDIMKMRLYL